MFKNVDLSEFDAESGVTTNGGGKNATLYKPELFRDKNGLRCNTYQRSKIRGTLRDELVKFVKTFEGLKNNKSKSMDKFLQKFLQWYSEKLAVTNFTIKSVTNSTEMMQNELLANLLQEAQKCNEKAKIIC